MRTDYFAQIPLTLTGGEVPAGALLGTIETAEGIPLEKFVNAVAVGHATPDRLPAAKAPNVGAPAAAVVAIPPDTAFVVKDATEVAETLQTAGNVVVVDEGHDR